MEGKGGRARPTNGIHGNNRLEILSALTTVRPVQDVDHLVRSEVAARDDQDDRTRVGNVVLQRDSLDDGS